MDIQKLFRIGIGIAIGIIIILLLVKTLGGAFSFGSKKTATIQSQTFQVEQALTEKQKQLGLSGRRSLGTNKSMLFSFETADYQQFWMKNMQFPIDILFIQGGKIVTIHKNIQPAKKDTPNNQIPTFTSTAPADQVLEINAGLVDKYGFKVGDQVTFSL